MGRRCPRRMDLRAAPALLPDVRTAAIGRATRAAHARCRRRRRLRVRAGGRDMRERGIAEPVLVRNGADPELLEAADPATVSGLLDRERVSLVYTGRFGSTGATRARCSRRSEGWLLHIPTTRGGSNWWSRARSPTASNRRLPGTSLPHASTSSGRWIARKPWPSSGLRTHCSWSRTPSARSWRTSAVRVPQRRTAGPRARGGH